MSEPAMSNDGILVPAGRGGLAPVTTPNSLVMRGLLDLADGRWLTVRLSEGINYYERGMECLENEDRENAIKNFDEAIRLLNEAIGRHPSHAEAYLYRGKSRWGKNCADPEIWDDDVINDFNEAIRLDPNNAEAYVERGVCQDYGDQIKDYDEAIRLDPKNALAYYNRGKALLDRENMVGETVRNNVWRERDIEFEDVIRDLDEAIRLDPKKASWHSLRGQISHDRAQYDEAIRYFDEAIRLDPNKADFYRHCGDAWLAKREFDRSIEAFNEAIRQKPIAWTFFRRGQAHSGKHAYDQAISDFGDAIRLGATFQALCAAAGRQNLFSPFIERGNAWVAKGDIDKAIQDYDLAIQIKATEGYFWRGRAWYLKKDYAKAIEDFDEAIRLDPTDNSSYNFRGVVWAARNEHDNAIKDYDEAIRLAPDEPIYYNNRGHSWEAKENLDKSVSDFDKAERLDRRKRTLPIPRSFEIDLPGKLSVLFIGRAVGLAQTPGLIEISPTTLAQAYDVLISGKRLEKLRSLNAPEVIIRNEISLLNRARARNAWNVASDKPEDYRYRFEANEQQFESSEFEKALMQLSAFTQLEELELSGCSINDNGLVRLQVLPNLRRLNLSKCAGITDQSLGHLAALTGLEHLDLAECSVTDAGLAFLMGLKNLRYLNLEECDNISQAQLSILQAALPQCEIEL